MTDEKTIEVPLALIEAVAHIGVDFGFGPYELERKWIEQAQSILINVVE